MQQELKQILIEREMQSQAAQLENCGKNFFFLGCMKCPYISKNKVYCKSKLCPECMKMRSKRFVDQVTPYLKSFSRPRFLTLTLQNVNSVSKENYLQLTKYFNNFVKRMQRAGFLFDKGILVIETTEKGKGFHLHLHILYDGFYLPQQMISDIWYDITKTSDVIDIRQPRSTEQVLRYLSKYISKGCSINSISSLVDYFQSTKHIRMFRTFGKNFKVVKAAYQKICPECNSQEWYFMLIDKTGDKPIIKITIPDPQHKILNSDEEILEKVKDVINIPKNIDEVMDRLSPQELEHLLKIGAIFQPRHDEYRLLE